jgi:hypothetical protein
MLRNSKRLSSKISRGKTLPTAVWKTNLPASDVPPEADAILIWVQLGAGVNGSKAGHAQAVPRPGLAAMESIEERGRCPPE